MSKKTDNLPWRDAIIKVLKEAGKAMHYTEITQQIIDQKLRKDVGATPASTVNAYISSEISTRPADAPFLRVDRGVYILREVAIATGATTVPAPKTPAEAEVESAGIIQAFGMFWRRGLVEWTTTPKLFGQQQEGAEVVDFYDQRGVYLLHDVQRAVYVGEATDRALGKRLCEHTRDRLNGRWDRFSWFGIRSVTGDGKLVDADLKSITPALLIITLEALLIEGLEPPQNRKRGDDFSAVEYLQVEDPGILQKRKEEFAKEILANIKQAK